MIRGMRPVTIYLTIRDGVARKDATAILGVNASVDHQLTSSRLQRFLDDLSLSVDLRDREEFRILLGTN
jgi:hypothetical protein